ncbi:MAG TPA: hypothetical protein VF657_03010 [Actinoplanes sp.]|jgi:hypothetical protein
MSDPRTEEQRVVAEIGHGAYGPGVLDEPTQPRADHGDDEGDELKSTLPASTDTEVLRDGGPHLTPGVMTTTGGTAGPASFPRRTNHPDGVKVAPTTTGDATTGGMDTVDGSTTSDASTNSVQ